MLLAPLRTSLVFLLFSLWWGGLTFYAVIVVPIGTEMFDATSQGFVTQRVTNWLNGLSLACLAALLWNVFVYRRLFLTIAWATMAVATVGLFALHEALDRMMDIDTQSVEADAGFYSWHRVYLWITALQWVAGLIQGLFFASRLTSLPRTQAPDALTGAEGE